MSRWILLRGLTREAGHWGNFVSALATAMPDTDTILALDLPGNGALHAVNSPCRVEDMVRMCRDALREQGHAPPYTLLAMSLGAMVAVAWAAAHPQEVTGCVLINTSLRPFSPFWQRLRPGQYPRILRLLLGPADAATWERHIMQMTSRHPVSAGQTLSNWLDIRRKRPVSTANGLRQLYAAIRYRAPAHCPSVPMLLLSGQGDQLVHPDCSTAVARQWQLPLLRHPTAGHDLPLDAGPWVLEQVLAWREQLVCGLRSPVQHLPRSGQTGPGP